MNGNIVKDKSFARNMFAVIIAGCLAIILIIIGECTGLTNLNLIPFGGPSWALWLYPVYFLLAYLILFFVFKLPKKYFWCLIILSVVVFIVFYIITNGNLFVNPVPFGHGASLVD